MNNNGYYGGALQFYSGVGSYMRSDTNQITITTCNNNIARVGAAIDSTRVKQLYNGGAIGRTLGTVNAEHMAVNFSGKVVFNSSQGTAIFIFSFTVDFMENSDIEFINYIGENGGAIFLTGDSSIIYLHYNTTVRFTNNSASENGGAIYVDQTKEHYAAYSYHCFIQYTPSHVPPWNWTTTVSFRGNMASKANNSIYTYSVLPCIWPVDISSNMTEDVHWTFCMWNDWTFDDDVCIEQIETSAAL